MLRSKDPKVILTKVAENVYYINGLSESDLFNHTTLRGTPEQIFLMLNGRESREGDIQ